MILILIVFLNLIFLIKSDSKTCICSGFHTNWNSCFFNFECNNNNNDNTNDNNGKCGNCIGSIIEKNEKAEKEKLKILIFNGQNDDVGYIYNNRVLDSCEYACDFQARNYNSPLPTDIDAILFSLIYLNDKQFPSINERTELEKKKQPWIAHCAESPANFFGRNLRNDKIMKRFQITATTSKQSTIPFNYLNLDLFAEKTWNKMIEPIQLPLNKFKKFGIAWFATNCKAPNKREQYVEKLMKLINIDSFGSCLNNKQLPIGAQRKDLHWQQTKIQLLSKYKFVLAFENSNIDDYVTEKFYHAFSAKSIPIYMGAKNILDYAPSANSFLNVDDFDNVEQLAEKISFLMNNDEEYLKFHEWRLKPIENNFSNLLNHSINTLPCRVCSTLHQFKKENQIQFKNEL